jgi:hypothetical protein
MAMKRCCTSGSDAERASFRCLIALSQYPCALVHANSSSRARDRLFDNVPAFQSPNDQAWPMFPIPPHEPAQNSTLTPRVKVVCSRRTDRTCPYGSSVIASGAGERHLARTDSVAKWGRALFREISFRERCRRVGQCSRSTDKARCGKHDARSGSVVLIRTATP